MFGQRADFRFIGLVLVISAIGSFSVLEASTLSCTYSMTLPRGGENWRHGTSQTISWNRVGTCSDRIDIHLLRDGAVFSTIATSVLSSSSSYRWTVSSSAGPARDYSIRIRDRDDLESLVISNQFTITNSSGCTTEVSKPAAGDTVYKDESVTVQWDNSGSCGSRVSLDLYRNTGYVQSISSDAPNNGEWIGSVPGEYATGPEFSVKITDLSDTTIYDFSGRFSIAAARPCVFEILSPVDEDTWYTDHEYSILWSSSGSCSSEVAIHLLEAGLEVLTIDSRASNSGEKAWRVPVDLQSGHDYTIRIRDTSDIESEGLSEVFSILDESGPAFIYWLDNVAGLDGAAGSVWRSDVVLLNQGEEEAEVELWLFAADGAQVYQSTVDEGSEGVFEDIVGLIGLEDKGCLGIGSSQPLQVSGRIYNQASSGTFGQYVQGWQNGEGLADGQWGRLLQLRQNQGLFRTNLTVTNTGTDEATVEVTLYNAAGNDLHTYRLDIGPRELLQDLEPFKKRAGRPNMGWGFAVVEVLDGSGLLISASVIDSGTNDGTTIPIIVSTQ